jgi:molybdopterin-guanine dinucleotide biosynthesis protein A
MPAALLLAGGRSTRMGSAKALLQWQGVPLVAHIAAVLVSVADPVIVVAAADQTLPPLPTGVEVAVDAQPEQGPLEAMSAGMRAVDGRADVVFVSAVDVPLLHAEFVLGVVDAVGSAQMALPVSAGRDHYLAAAYRLELRGLVEQLLVSGERRVGAVADRVPVNRVDSTLLPHPESLRNANTPQQLERLRSETTV